MREIGDYSTRATHLSISFAGDAMYQREVKGKLIRLTNSSADTLEMYSDGEKNVQNIVIGNRVASTNLI